MRVVIEMTVVIVFTVGKLMAVLKVVSVTLYFSKIGIVVTGVI